MFVLKTNGSDNPVLLWLQGGPGHSSLFGALVENGPFGIDKDLHSENTPQFYRASALNADTRYWCLSVRLSVRLSVVFRYCIKTA